jgi:hypothetical protein
VPQLAAPRQPRLLLGHRSTEVWIPYPASPDPQDSHIALMFEQLCDLCIVYEEVGHFLQALKVNRAPRLQLEQRVEAFHRRLLHWQKVLPECVAVGHNSLPHVIATQ